MPAAQGMAAPAALHLRYEPTHRNIAES